MKNKLNYKTFLVMTSLNLWFCYTGCSDEFSSHNYDKAFTTKESEEQNMVASDLPHRLMVWGDDTFGQVSNAPDGKFKVLADGGSINGLALRWDNTPVLWGSGPFGLPPIPEELTAEEFFAIAIGRDDAVLIRKNHTLVAFGQSTFFTNVPSGFYNTVTIGAVHAIAIADDGTLTAWGSDSQLMPYGLVTGLLNLPQGGPFISVKARLLCSLALHQDGTLYGWGHPAYGVNILEGWTSTPEDQEVYYLPELKFKSIAVGNVHALAIQPNGTVVGWGDGSGGALIAPPNIRFNEVAAGWGFSVGIATDGTLWGWGTPFKNPFATEGWTFASQGWTRYNNTEYFYIPDKRFKSVSAAAFHLEALTLVN